MAIAFVYSGQGAQYFGMGQELYNEYAVVRNVFDEASAVLGYDVANLCFQENEQLHLTEYTQPAILTVSYALDQLLAEKGIQPDFVAGLSLGEYTALVKANAFSFNEAISLVAKRGKYMSEAVPAGRGKMAAVMNAERSVIEEACREASKTAYVAPANYNMPTQIVIGGEIEGVDKAIELLEAKGVRRIIPLNVSGPFHTALLHPAAEKLAVALSELTVNEPTIPVIGNTEATVVTKDAIKGLLVRQVESPVLWEDSVLKMIDLGVDTFVEVGPGTTLSKFIKKINKDVSIYNVEDLKSFNKTIEALQK
ncbi:acyl transferase/acyl hydrolase/lysophospholipase [Trichococcus palustris]|jgi:[acyl-carrier-protein] S-malonyltransferase|uniref:Malonyl CoA-acyl carrier protein transacylase n=1 Tax=Trichococcus palustris TaxID=140314 RepID=A0A143YCC3_9LACT|nr:ACP S-malonyltransferase [Trichococcus palustris]CZQ87302.1 acyl transferase/acyl hydrolase/lysophospholipase [Trichococcus palustris]SFK79299.1 [acyl-carrier-protein] S-malonyltransferase [Trichococcus palustris]